MAYPLCKAENPQSVIDEKQCNKAEPDWESIYMAPECGYDNGGCCDDLFKGMFKDLYNGNMTLDRTKLGDGVCDDYPYNSRECQYDKGDCVPDMPFCKVSTPSRIGNGICDLSETGYNTEDCEWDGGDCILPDYPDCHLPFGQDLSLLGDGECNFDLPGYNTQDCEWDGGDCILLDYPDCHPPVGFDPSLVGNGVCDEDLKHDATCGYDGYDCCLDIANNTHSSDLGDGNCTPALNIPECAYDEGDCKVLGFPDCHVDEPNKIGDGNCNEDYNIQECNFDNGDCRRTCGEDEIVVHIIVETDGYPNETSWKLIYSNYSDSTVVEYEASMGGETPESYQTCVANTTCLTFTIYDSYGDGIYVPGGYKVSYGDAVIVDKIGVGSAFGYKESILFGTCASFNPSTQPSTQPATSSNPSSQPSITASPTATVLPKVMVKYYIISEIEPWSQLPMDGLESLDHYAEDWVKSIDIRSGTGDFATSGRENYVAALFQGYVDFPGGETELCIASDDGSKLYIDGEDVIDNDGLHGVVRKCQLVDHSGVHKIAIEYFEDYGGSTIIFEWQLEGSKTPEVVPPSAWRDAPSSIAPTRDPGT